MQIGHYFTFLSYLQQFTWRFLGKNYYQREAINI